MANDSQTQENPRQMQCKCMANAKQIQRTCIANAWQTQRQTHGKCIANVCQTRANRTAQANERQTRKHIANISLVDRSRYWRPATCRRKPARRQGQLAERAGSFCVMRQRLYRFLKKGRGVAGRGTACSCPTSADLRRRGRHLLLCRLSQVSVGTVCLLGPLFNLY